MSTLVSGEVYSLAETAKKASDYFGALDPSKRKELISIGIPPIDNVLGGLFPGSCGILAAANGVGKSSMALTAAVHSTAKAGIINVEDTLDVTGTRAIAMYTGIDSLKIRRGDLNFQERSKIAGAMDRMGDEDGILFAYPTGGDMTEVLLSVEHLAEAGCRIVFLDYVQKIRGIKEDRVDEIATAYTKFQSACAKSNVAALVLSQFSRQYDPTREPTRYMLKGTGDLENEARIIILGWRDNEDPNLVRWKLDKSTFGGEFLRFQYRRDQSGTLCEVGKDYE